MKEEEYQFILFDRVEKIKQINEQYDLENNAYISFSGGKDSTVLHYLIDIALPKNKIPRLFLNTGIEYKYIREFVQELAKNDNRIIVYNSGVNIKQMLDKEGYPFKSKEHSLKISEYKKGSRAKNIVDYRYKENFGCPKILQYQYNDSFKLHISNKCCNKLKKEPAKKWAKENNKTIILTGMRKEEGGQRISRGCVVTDKNKNLIKFHPLLVVSEEWENEFIKRNNINLCKLYYPPFNFKRTGCKGCPFALGLQEQLNVMERLLPNEKNQCEILWAPVYKEYRRIGYRLRKKKDYEQISIFDFEECNDFGACTCFSEMDN